MGLRNARDRDVLACTLDGDPNLVVQAWDLWPWEMPTWRRREADEARFWLDAVLLGGLAWPD